MKRATGWLLAWFAIAPLSAAEAAWRFVRANDPLSDAAGAIAEATRRLDRAAYTILFRCSAGTTPRLTLGVITSAKWDHTGRYPDRVEIKVRVDDGQVFTVLMKPREHQASLSYVMGLIDSPAVLKAAAQIARAKRRIIVAVGGTLVDFPVANAPKSMAAMAKVCGLPLVEPPAQEATKEAKPVQ